MRPIEESLCGDEWTMIGPDGREFPACVPGCAHVVLQRAGVIPLVDAQGGEAAQEWVGRSEFLFKRVFRVSKEMREHRAIDLVFQSIDTVAEIRVDGESVLRTANQFHPHRVSIADRVRGMDLNHEFLLEVRCAGPVAEVLRIERERGTRPVNGDWTPYPFIRKPACDFGWDWGPRAPSSGIVDVVYVQGWSGMRIDSVRPLVMTCSAIEARVEVIVNGVCDGDATQYEARVEMESPDGRTFDGVASFSATGVARVIIEISDPMRWWPRGYGAQHLYRVSVEVTKRAARITRWSGRIGLRSVVLDTTPDADGTRFALRVNDQLVWCAGANWIPEGLNRMIAPEASVRERLLQACEANLVMLRVWGGGGYESPSWYAQCDELGLLVWQDFAFACATYPEEDPLPTLIEAEARFQIARLSAHPSVVIWCGGNEDVLAWQSWGFRERLRAGQSWGRHYWMELLPRLCAELDGTRPYWPESPWSGSLELPANDASRGDRHTWDATAKVEGLRSITPRFASEFGHQSPPALQSIATALSIDAHELSRQSVHDGCALIASRQRATGGDEPQYGTHLSERFAPPMDFGNWIAQAQIVQAKAMRIAYTWLRANRPRCSGALVWQMNDAWTGASWSLVDSHGRLKPAWWAVREACAPRMIVLHERDGRLVVDAVNDTPMTWRSRVMLGKFACSVARDPITREFFEEGFTVEPWGAARALEVPAQFLPDASSLLFAESATEIRVDPIATAWHAAVRELQMQDCTGAPFVPRATMEWASAPASMRGRVMATLNIHALTPLMDALVIPEGDWITVEPMWFSLAPGAVRQVEVRWRADARGVELFAGGVRIAQLA